MRLLVGVLAVVAVAFLLASPAAASCRPPASVAENAARAVAVIHGTVTESGGGALTLRIDRTLKGPVGGTVRVFVGPGRGGGGDTAVATSIDYPGLGPRPVRVGSDHVLYLIRGGDDQLETSACIGSHAGPPDAAELALFGSATAPSVLPGTLPPAATDVPPAAGPQIWPLLLLAILGGAALILFRRRSSLRSGDDLRAN